MGSIFAGTALGLFEMAQLTRDQLIAMVRGVAARYGVDPEIAIKQLAQESGNFAPAVVYGPRKSSAGAMGIAQFMPATAKRFGLKNAYDPVAALEAWGQYMRLLLQQFNGRYDLALAGYNWGENRATLRTALASGKAVTTYAIPAETKNYVAKILAGSSLPANVATVPAPAAAQGVAAVSGGVSGGPDAGAPSWGSLLTWAGIAIAAVWLTD